MATISLSLTLSPDDLAQEVIDAFCDHYEYNPASGDTQRQFIKKMVINYLREPYARKTQRSAEQGNSAAVQAAIAAVTIS